MAVGKGPSTKPDNMVQSPEPIGGRRITPETCLLTAIHLCLSTRMHARAPAYKIKKFSIAMCIYTHNIKSIPLLCWCSMQQLVKKQLTCFSYQDHPQGDRASNPPCLEATAKTLHKLCLPFSSLLSGKF